MGTPTKLGKYVLDPNPLGQGAMGVVYKGFDPDLRHAVAIKVIRRELVEGPGGEPMRQRFKNEAIAGRRLRHPNVVPVYEYGEDEDCSYIVMAFVEGRPLKEALDAGRRPSVSEALAITRELLDALQHAHRHNVVHRDIKPANLLVGADGELHVADFGIAKIDLADLTRTGQVLGTPAYMSPEQCQATPSDHRADIFAAGVILYELLTGEQPFRAKAALAVMHQVLTVEPMPPSKLNLDVSAALDAVVAKAMAKRREERFQSAREFAQALEEAAKPRPVPAEDIRSITDTDTDPGGPDPTPPRTSPKTPADPPPKAASESPPKTPSAKDHRRSLFRPGSARRSWLAVAFPAVVAAGVLALLVGKNDVRTKETTFPTLRDRFPDGSGLAPEMVVLPGGRFQMGCLAGDDNCDPEELPAHTVSVPAFAIGRYEVTFEEYDRFAKDTKRKLPDDQGWGRERQPVIYVHWDDAQSYAAWLSEKTGRRYRLPTEAEWEYAARAGTMTSYWWGNQVGRNHANCRGCGSQWDGKQAAPAGSFAPNPFGLYDTAGNVWEWVQDCYHGKYQGAPADGSAWLETGGRDCSRVIRGGSWFSIPGEARSADHSSRSADGENDRMGFRLAGAL